MTLGICDPNSGCYLIKDVNFFSALVSHKYWTFILSNTCSYRITTPLFRVYVLLHPLLSGLCFRHHAAPSVENMSYVQTSCSMSSSRRDVVHRRVILNTFGTGRSLAFDMISSSCHKECMECFEYAIILQDQLAFE